jgi:hypothetical protein
MDENSSRGVLMITAMPGAENCAAMLTRQLGRDITLSANRRMGLAALRRSEFSVLIVDSALMADDPAGADLLWQHAGLAVPVEINFGISGCARVVREVKAALARRAQESSLARRAAALSIESELKSTVTGLLLQSELALKEPSLSPQLESKLKHLVELAGDLRHRLRPVA